jgi:class 3 adenylate cyclase
MQTSRRDDGWLNPQEQASAPAQDRGPKVPSPGERGRVMSFERYARDRLRGAEVAAARPRVTASAGSGAPQPDAPGPETAPLEAKPEGTRVVVTILLTDIVNSTAHVVGLGDRRWLDLRTRHDDLVRDHVLRFRGRMLLNTGDGLVAVFDVPMQAVRAATAIQLGMKELGLEARAGIHTGECEIRRGEPAGIAFHIAARVAAKGAPGEVLVSQTVRDLVLGSELAFVERGAHALKGLPGEWHLYAAEA